VARRQQQIAAAGCVTILAWQIAID